MRKCRRERLLQKRRVSEWGGWVVTAMSDSCKIPFVLKLALLGGRRSPYWRGPRSCANLYLLTWTHTRCHLGRHQYSRRRPKSNAINHIIYMTSVRAPTSQSVFKSCFPFKGTEKLLMKITVASTYDNYLAKWKSKLGNYACRIYNHLCYFSIQNILNCRRMNYKLSLDLRWPRAHIEISQKMLTPAKLNQNLHFNPSHQSLLQDKILS